MKTTEIRGKSKSELEDLIKEKRERLRFLKFNLVAGKLKNVREIRVVKKDIARILTIMKHGT